MSESDDDTGKVSDLLPDCAMRRALEIAEAREEREGGRDIFNLLKHLFPEDLPEEEMQELLTEFFHSGAHHAIDTARRHGASPFSPLCFLMGFAFAEGMAFGAEGQRIFEQETRDALSELPEVTR
jgi:hypothetical protein